MTLDAAQKNQHTQAIHEVIHPWQGKAILNGYLVDSSRISTHSLFSLFLRRKYNKYCTWAQTFPDQPSFQQLMHLYI